MNIVEFSMRLRELSDDYANQRLMPDEYRIQRKIILDQIDSMMNGVDSDYTEEVVTPSADNEINIMPEDADEEEVSIIGDTIIEDEQVLSAESGYSMAEQMPDTQEAEKPAPASGFEKVSQRLNDVLGRRLDNAKDENN